MSPNRRMLQRRIAFSVRFLSYFIFYETMKPESFHYPRTSYLQIVNTQSKHVCFISCLNKPEVHYMFSYNHAGVAKIYPEVKSQTMTGRHMNQVHVSKVKFLTAIFSDHYIKSLFQC